MRNENDDHIRIVESQKGTIDTQSVVNQKTNN